MILTVKDAAKYIGISPRTVQRLIKEGKFPQPAGETDFGKDHTGTKTRKLRCWREEDLEEYKEQVRTVGRPKGDRNCQ